METIDIVKRKSEQLERSLQAQMNVLLRQNKDFKTNRLFNLYLGKVFGMCELLNELGMKEEAASLEWAYKFGI